MASLTAPQQGRNSQLSANLSKHILAAHPTAAHPPPSSTPNTETPTLAALADTPSRSLRLPLRDISESRSTKGRESARPGLTSGADMYNIVDDSAAKPARMDTLVDGTDMATPALRGLVVPHPKGSASLRSQETKEKNVGAIRSEGTVQAGAVTAVSSSVTTASSTAMSSRRSSFVAELPAHLLRLTPPDNFGTVVDGKIFRSAYPKPENYEYLKTLKVKSILTLVKEECPEPYAKFIAENGIRHYRVHVPANKGQVCIPPDVMVHALMVVLDRSNYPLLIHCNKGKHRTGCVVACLGKVLGKSKKQIKEDYHTYAAEKARAFDEQFVESFDERSVLWMARFHGWASDNEPRSPLPTPARSPRQAA
ncbi:tyrosine-protein phosphatase siw14 [Diplodia corticola]|uniref:diphosphoinositol-polyphosphate diphosphatase n=1 Tax=Diplodia corticola TaxID=236234 RepID=A0A1J9QM02_9PEZI|nr:tyrosine-protein phosphatase siw14 [Diplodia corticola]OJD29934.1 tyrosine-protein phosphatase siw14 [Diplodia corticola]